MNQQNKHGLPRYVPPEVKKRIRQASGFGCIFCGSVVAQYEHIEPEFKDARQHDPERMTLLCGACHDKVTRRHISKASVWAARENPRALQDGYAHDILYANTAELEIWIGNSTSRKTNTILTIHGKPIIWFESPRVSGEPSKLCAIFYDDSGRVVAYINRNEFIAFSSSQDVKSESTRLLIRANGKVCLEVDREGEEAIKITSMEARYLKTSVRIDSSGGLVLQSGNSSINLERMHVENCGSAISLGGPPSTAKYFKLGVAQKIAASRDVVSLMNFKHHHVGWLLGNEIFNHKYEIVGIVQDNKVFNPVGEYIGNVSDSFIVYPDDCYETGEPIYTPHDDRLIPISDLKRGYDVSFRLFGFD